MLNSVRRPAKNTVNFARRQGRAVVSARAAAFALAVAVSIAVFTKFGVLGRFEAERETGEALSEAQRRLAGAVEANSDYESVLAQYNRYFLPELSETEVDSLGVLELTENVLLSNANVRSVSVSSNTMLVGLSGLTLDRASEMIDLLMTQELVKSVSISSVGAATARHAPDEGEATAVDSADVSITMLVILEEGSG